MVIALMHYLLNNSNKGPFEILLKFKKSKKVKNGIPFVFLELRN
jgi:hypothetical protein